MTYTHTGIYTYTVSEQPQPADSTNKVTNSTATYTVVVKTELDQDKNALMPTVTINGEPVQAGTTGRLDFTNTYTPTDVTIGTDAQEGIKVQKTLDGRAWIDSDAFDFTLEAETAGAPHAFPMMATRSRLTSQRRPVPSVRLPSPKEHLKDSDGNYLMEKTFTHKVSEVVPEGAVNNVKDGITYDGHTAYVDVTISDDGLGKLSVKSITYRNDNASDAEDAANTVIAAFTNTYAAEGSLAGDAQLGVTKKVVGADFTDSLTFDFTMKLTGTPDGVTVSDVLVGDDRTPMTGDGVYAAISGGDGVADGQKTTGFGSITFTKPGDYTFTVSRTTLTARRPSTGRTTTLTRPSRSTLMMTTRAS